MFAALTHQLSSREIRSRMITNQYLGQLSHWRHRELLLSLALFLQLNFRYLRYSYAYEIMDSFKVTPPPSFLCITVFIS